MVISGDYAEDGVVVGLAPEGVRVAGAGSEMKFLQLVGLSVQTSTV